MDQVQYWKAKYEAAMNLVASLQEELAREKESREIVEKVYAESIQRIQKELSILPMKSSFDSSYSESPKKPDEFHTKAAQWLHHSFVSQLSPESIIIELQNMSKKFNVSKHQVTIVVYECLLKWLTRPIDCKCFLSTYAKLLNFYTTDNEQVLELIYNYSIDYDLDTVDILERLLGLNVLEETSTMQWAHRHAFDLAPQDDEFIVFEEDPCRGSVSFCEEPFYFEYEI